jgi:Isochorismatase family
MKNRLGRSTPIACDSACKCLQGPRAKSSLMRSLLCRPTGDDHGEDCVYSPRFGYSQRNRLKEFKVHSGRNPERLQRAASELGYEVTMVKDATADYSDQEMHAALDVNMPNCASAIVTTNEVVNHK